jgi:AI-2 transport protein TqsA
MEKPNLRDAEQRTQTICLLILSAISICVALLYLRQVLLPFVLALFLTMAVTPVMDFLVKRFRFPRGLAIAATFLIASVVLLCLGALVSAALGEAMAKKGTYVAQVERLIEETESRFDGLKSGLEGFLPGADAGADQPLSERPSQLSQDSELAAAVSGQEATSTPFDDLREKVGGMALGAIGWATGSALALLSQGLLVLVFMMFLITGYRPPDQRDPTSLNFQLRARIKDYLRVKIIVSAITGVATYLILDLIGIDLALVFGLMAFFLNFIPNVGSAVAILLPLPMILLAPPEEVSMWAKALAIALPGTVQFLMGNVLEPRWMGKSLDLNPIMILLSLIFWGVIWGPIGMLLSVPITAVIKMLLERSELTRPVAALFADGE